MAPAIQTAYTRDPPVGRIGQISHSVPCTTRTYVNGAAAVIPFGVAVQRSGASATEAVMGGAGGGSAPFHTTDFLGVTVEDRTREEEGYSQGANMAVITMGDIWVQVSGAVGVGDGVTANDTTGELGAAGTNGVGNANNARIPGAIWKTAAADNGLAILSLNAVSQVG